jgi:hypothetical protein
MGLETAIATLATAKALVGLAPVAGPVLAGVMDAATEICKAAQVCLQCQIVSEVEWLISVQNVKTNEEQYRALGERVSMLCSSLADDQTQQELASGQEHGGQLVTRSEEMARKIDGLHRCVFFRNLKASSDSPCSELRRIAEVVKTKEKRDNKDYKGKVATAQKSTRRFVGRFWHQEGDKAEVDALQMKVNRLLEQFQVSIILVLTYVALRSDRLLLTCTLIKHSSN